MIKGILDKETGIKKINEISKERRLEIKKEIIDNLEKH